MPVFGYYLLGLFLFEAGLVSLLWNGGEIKKFIFALISLLLIFLSSLTNSHLFALFGTLGTVVYLSYLADVVFGGSILFPLALTVIGVGIFVIGIGYSRYYTAFRQGLLKLFP